MADKKVGVQFYITADTGPELTGKSVNFTITIRNNSNGDTSTGITTGSFSELAESAGTYQVPVTISNIGDYTAIINNTTDGLGSITAPITVKTATVDDVNTSVISLQSDITSVKSQVDTLDEVELNNISEKINNVRDLIMNKTATLTFSAADESSKVKVGDNVTGSVSGATGSVESVTYGTDTVIVVVGVVGTFVNSEELNGGYGGITTTGIDSVVEGNGTVDSVLEFVQQIDSALTDGSTGLAALEGFTDDIELMLTGTEFLQDGTTPNPFYDATNAGVAKESTLASMLSSLNTSINTARDNVKSHIDTLVGANTDIAGTTTLYGKIASVKQVVDTNSTILSHGTYGLDALRSLIEVADTAIDTLANRFNDGGDVELRFDALDTAVANMQTALESRFDTVDSSLTTITTKVDNILGSGGARIYV